MVSEGGSHRIMMSDIVLWRFVLFVFKLCLYDHIDRFV